VKSSICFKISVLFSICLIILCTGAQSKSGSSNRTSTVKISVRSGTVTIINSVPSSDRGSGIKNFKDAFHRATKSAVKGSVSLQVGREPVYIIDGDITGKNTVRAENSPFGFHPANIQGDRDPFGAAVDIGIRWHRGFYAYWIIIQRTDKDIETGRFNWAENDREWGAVPASMAILANIGLPERLKTAPGKEKESGPRRRDRTSILWQLNKPESSFIKFVKAAVERYDGDGKNDMPGLKVPIRYWQFENEPDLGGNRDWEGFAHLQETAYKAIKEACPEARVVMGGQSGYTTEIFDSYYVPILKKLDGRFVDVFDFHYYGDACLDWQGVRKAYEHIRSTLLNLGYKKTEIWITEMGSYSGSPGDEKSRADTSHPHQITHIIKDRPQTEREQARDVVKRHVYPLALGVRKVFWAFGLMEGFKHDDGYFDHTGFIYDGEFDNDPPRGTRKLSYFTYRLMTEILDGADWNRVKILDIGKDIYAISVPKGKGIVTILWYDPPYRLTELLSPERVTEIRSILKAMEREKTSQDNVVRRYEMLFQIIQRVISEGGPSAVNSWAPREKVMNVAKKISEKKADGPEELDRLIRKASLAFE